ncbi:hypothetical protein SAMN05421493_104102 [Pseudobutyrivibrio sp. 49]|uniref:hypothetical protein n=1 Tax=Pseudobutyrivibrio sp. 49 TaxID=1855344 RepID=UPI00088F7684|nr:hypothetical protein [Pseudobutyrivibrio sp. 49]SDH81445.1 hypothetical protein SAMN05421493_104102 [Pseudobutyrivibrio sp. 49]
MAEENLNPAISKIMDIYTFEKGVKNGTYSDSKGIAYLILNGTLYTTYNVYIDRQRITKAGSVVTFQSLLKTYGSDEIQIRYDLKEQRLPSLRAYRNSKETNNNSEKKHR